MTENLEKNTQTDRLIEFCSTKDLKTQNSIEKFLSIGNGYINKAKQRGGDLSGSTITKLAELFPDINLRWLLTGKGNMHESTVSQTFMNDANQTQEIMNLTRLLTKTQQDLIDKMKEVEKLHREKDIPSPIHTPKLKPGES